ncbi:MAG: class I tRNA ligase family protein [Candidatus Colwellbacteria bacterium]|nr:class I tRNA ligase family protein [Candidatus Colwellbacteria bacterium]
MDTRYDPKETEDRIYKRWEESGFFNPDVCVKRGVTKKNAKHFSIVLPPPNVTGTLHMGHAAMLAIEDIMVRYERMKGKKTLWLPGTDHAAIATQSKVEGIIYKKEGKTRYDLGREEFLRRVEEFAKESHDAITNQVRKMGSSVDWSREAYTLDAKRSRAVVTAFQKMYDDGLIYRGARIVNWDPKMQTTVSDDEVERVEEKAPFYYLKYGPFTIGTARPETKFGDKYVVVHPADKRYKKYKHAEKLNLEWINGPITATVIKDKAVDMGFGTGVMTITPWHDTVDFEIAERHKLDREQIIDNNGKLLSIAGEFAGMHIKKARPLIVQRLQEKGLLAKTDDSYVHNIATNSRGGGIIEPQIKEQWFVDVNKKFVIKKSKIKGVKSGSKITLKEMMKKVVASKQIEIIPRRFEKTYFRWINNLRDWCISRQIWYGHRIPVWYCVACGTPIVNPVIKSKWFLIRHGETDHNKGERMAGRLEASLNESGISQARKAADELKNHNIDLIISSDMMRCRQTAEIIAKATGAEIVYEKQLREQNHGEAEGMLRTEAFEKYGDTYSYEATIPGSEGYKDVEERAWKAFSHHKKSHHHRNVVIVTHGGVIRTLVKRIRNWDVEQMLSTPSIKNAAAIELDLASQCVKCKGDLYEQDTDTLDTWFSSGLWTFSTLGWPENTDDLKTFHPTSVIETGYDIIFFWVARMILMTGNLLGDVPFRKVYMHGLVRDASGRKMSKSLGNIIDPLDLIEKYGADATRLSLIIGSAAGNDMKLSEDKVRGYRNFSTKIWNASRFVLMNYKPSKVKPKFTAKDKKNIEELGKIKKRVAKYLEAFDFNHAAEVLYHYFWHTFADKIIESAKPRLNSENLSDKAAAQVVLMTILKESVKMLHPFIPFVTEEVWSRLPGDKKILMAEKW